jgi:hypothetical protein
MLPPSAVGASAAGAVVLFTFTPPDEMPLKPAETDSLDPAVIGCKKSPGQVDWLKR